MSARVLVTGATGFIGARLAARLASAGRGVRCLVRDRGTTRARELEREGFDLHEGDVLRPETLRGAGHGIDVAYYPIHSMGRGGPKDFAASERAAATAFAAMACAEGIERVIYLGGLGDRPQSHTKLDAIRSRPHRPRTAPGADAGELAGEFESRRVAERRSFEPALASGQWHDLWVYVVGPLLDAPLGALTYQHNTLAASPRRTRLHHTPTETEETDGNRSVRLPA